MKNGINEEDYSEDFITAAPRPGRLKVSHMHAIQGREVHVVCPPCWIGWDSVSLVHLHRVDIYESGQQQ